MKRWKNLKENSMFLYGASGHAKVIIEILEKSNIKIKGLFDDDKSIKSLLNYKVFGKFNKKILNNDKLIISIGDNKIRKSVSEKLSLIKFEKVISINSIISTRTKIGEGTVIMEGVVINSSVSIGKHVIVNTSASIDHDSTISDYVHISPNATITGNVSIGEGSHIGANATIIPNIKIGKWCIIGAGAVIIKDIPDNCVIVGNPGKIIKQNYEK